MKLPWVSRESAERLVAYHEQNAAEWKALFRAEAASNVELRERLLTLKMAGAVELPKEREWDGLTAPAPQPDELRDLVHERFGANPRVLRGALAQLAKDRKAGKLDEEIVSAILVGYSPEGVPA